jgi:hypothetical protein
VGIIFERVFLVAKTEARIMGSSFRSFSHEAARQIQLASFKMRRRYFIAILNQILYFLESSAFNSSYLNPLTGCCSVRAVIQACGISYIHTCVSEAILVGGACLFQNSMDVIFMPSRGGSGVPWISSPSSIA